MGGPYTNPKEAPIRLAKEWDDRPNRYGKPIGNRIFGVTTGERTLVSRIHDWTVRPRAKESDPE